MKYFLISLFSLFCLIGCEPEEVTQDLIADMILNGDIVTVTSGDGEQSDVEVNGIIIGTIRSAIVTGCFGIPTCVKLTESNRGIIKLDIDDFSFYGEESSPNPPTGSTYFSTIFYNPYWYTNANHHAFKNQVDNHEDGLYQGKRLGWCNNHPERCNGEEE